MPKLNIPDLKSLRESLCVAQSAIGQTYASIQTAYAFSHIGTIQELIDKIDILRPLGPDGKHGSRHTENCGCDDIKHRELLHEWRVIPSFPMYELAGVGNIRVAGHSNPNDAEYIRTKGAITMGYDTNGNQELRYGLYKYENETFGYCLVHVRELINETFPELRKE